MHSTCAFCTQPPRPLSYIDFRRAGRGLPRLPRRRRAARFHKPGWWWHAKQRAGGAGRRARLHPCPTEGKASALHALVLRATSYSCLYRVLVAIVYACCIACPWCVVMFEIVQANDEKSYTSYVRCKTYRPLPWRLFFFNVFRQELRVRFFLFFFSLFQPGMSSVQSSLRVGRTILSADL